MLDIPSGHDLRGAITTKTFDVSWSPNSTSVPAPMWTFGAGTLVPNMTPASGSLTTTSPQTMTVQPSTMTVADITANPFASLSRRVTFNSGTPCNFTKDITINQTNYTIQSFNNAKGVAGVTNKINIANNFIRLMNNSTVNMFRIKSNASWKTTIANPSTIFSSTIPTTGGTDLTNGTIPPNNDYTLTGIAGTDTKYQTATITIEDSSNPKRAKDVTVTVYSCIGTVGALVGLQSETSANSNRSDWKTAWAKNVILHQGKAGVYEEFTSADFGTAGRWMTTNLSATAYDGIAHSQGRTLTGPNGNNPVEWNTAYWAYPSVTSPTTATEYNANKYIGLLYTWDAATAGKGGNTGKDQVGVAPNYEAGVDHSNFQGICPKGWHLPSDYEWTQLEHEIIKQTTSYAYVSKNIHDEYPDELAKLPQNTDGINSSWRGTYHATPMKEMCESSPNYDPQGASKPSGQGGFSVTFAGHTDHTSVPTFGRVSFYWSSSSINTLQAANRVFSYDYRSVACSANHRYYMMSIRCKKDN